MPETRTTATALAITTEAPRPALPAAPGILARIGSWASDTAQEFAALVSVLMGPAVLSAYVLAAWSLASNLGWTNTFLFTSGPLSNWLICFAIAVSVHLASMILARRSAPPSEK